MANEKTDIDNAQKAVKQIAGYAVSIPQQTDMVDKAFKSRDKPLEYIRSLITGLAKEAKEYRDNVDAAAKTLKAVRKWKSADAADAVKKLENALGAADAAVSALERNAALFDKVWDNCWSAEKALRQVLERTGDAAQTTSAALQTVRRDMSAQLATLQKQLDLARRAQQQAVAAAAGGPPSSGSSPADTAASKGLQSMLTVLVALAKGCGPQITTAESVCSSIDTALKKEDAAYHPDVQRLAQANRKLRQELVQLVAAVRALLGKVVTGVNDSKAVLAGRG